MFDWLVDADKAFFLFLNSFHNETFDKWMLFITGKKSWYPMYGMIITFLFVKYRKERWFIFIAIAILITFTEQIASGLFKPLVERLRPCHDPELDGLVHILKDKCGSKFGFFSAHASNTFGISFFIHYLTKDRYKSLGWVMIFWAAVVSYSRIYAGVHFPLDILAGAICGVLCAKGVYTLYLKGLERFIPKTLS